MKTKFSINMDRLKERVKPKARPMKLCNFRIEEELFEAFKELCEKDLKADYSVVLREAVEDMCVQLGYVKK